MADIVMVSTKLFLSCPRWWQGTAEVPPGGERRGAAEVIRRSGAECDERMRGEQKSRILCAEGMHTAFTELQFRQGR